MRFLKTIIAYICFVAKGLTCLRRRRRSKGAHPRRRSTDRCVGLFSVPGCPGAPGLLRASQLLQQRQSPPAAPPWDGCGPIDRTVNRPRYKHMDTVYNCPHTNRPVNNLARRLLMMPSWPQRTFISNNQSTGLLTV